ncbi:GNAT family N-acetyltransferase [Planomicrobium sp. CPCC 101110]|uniref:GNAT family N-acetyltransferase n=1 Tax=Planomicrobium sp. CPCC 101110 TaxID=2599619 RepID=UPI0011B69958|nr:GNAT family N-acetyltransferase [Planomicrobium sp. CPCC 101110]TWT27136.1 GNAT family N-acetyltransferase [Planomicrobium sp. CPCC 101110]
MQKSEVDYSAGFQHELEGVLSLATSKADEEYAKYMKSANRKLYVCEVNHTIAGCIGIRFLAVNSCKIKHIAVAPENRSRRIASEMVDFVYRKYGFSSIHAETDRDAMGFYRKNGFAATNLGEKYPGRERFLCRKEFFGAK